MIGKAWRGRRRRPAPMPGLAGAAALGVRRAAVFGLQLARALSLQLAVARGELAAQPAAGVEAAQEGPSLAAGARVARLEADPSAIAMDAGNMMRFSIRAYDAEGNIVNPVLRINASLGALELTTGMVRALEPGEHAIIATVVTEGPAPDVPALVIPVHVGPAPARRVEIHPAPGRLYVGTTLAHTATAYLADDSPKPNAVVHWTSSNPNIAVVDPAGGVTALRTGRVTITADVDGAQSSVTYDVAALPANRLEIVGLPAEARTGDVLPLRALATGSGGREYGDVPVTWSYTFVPDDSIAAPSNPAQIADGRFVAAVPGHYTIIADAGSLSARYTVRVRPRDVVRPVEFVGQGRVNHVRTTDLWVFEGRNGRDYAITGTWSGNGYAYFWDVTDPSAIVKVDSIQLDARTVNDVKVSPDARYAVLTREGASDRRNGVVLVDISDPARPRVASSFDEQLTGGVHNVFATDYHLFAVSGGERLVIVDVSDITQPRLVSEFRFPEPDARIHDVWVHEGLAYVSQWSYGVAVVDVGAGRWGGSPSNPVLVTRIPVPSGAIHSAFPYRQPDSGRLYLFLSDEVLTRAGMALGDTSPADSVPSHTAGFVHIVEWTDPERPRHVARYHVPEYGTHNIWVENDRLYVAYYEGGLRVVDVSGELAGNLYEQGREIAAFKTYDPEGLVPNAPMAWGVKPHKGHIFVSDWNSGLWAVRVE